MNKKLLLGFGLFLGCLTTVSAQQKVKDGTVEASNIANKDAIIEFETINKGILYPRVSLRNTNLASPLSLHVAGMVVYNTATTGDVVPGIYFNDGTRWYKTAQGNAGIDGKSVLSDTGNPLPSTGKNGDTYINTLTGDTYVNNNGTWIKNGNIKGAVGPKGDTGTQGLAGIDGKSVLSDAGNPLPSIGKNGDTYVNTSTGDTYINNNGTWIKNGNIKGAVGPKGDTGAQGLAGLTGNQGPKGDTGAQGLAGLTGSQGPKGDTGAQGLAGIDGKSVLSDAGNPLSSTGKNGDTYVNTSTGDTYINNNGTWIKNGNIKGAVGPKGDTGVQGNAGIDGKSVLSDAGNPLPSTGKNGDTYVNTSTGDTYINNNGTWIKNGNIKGAVGPKGDTGAQGLAGLTGSQGPKGDTGAQGLAGLTGSQGPKGDTGAQGLAGLTGNQGPKGDTGVQGLAGLTGSQGPKGDTGAQGLAGLTGSQGPKGDTGAQGLAGLTGSQGPKGDTGAQGLAGLTGSQGPKGDTGAQGLVGLTGNQGPKGDTGAQGLVGLTGNQGPKGDTGSQGLTGTQGPKGDTGAQGLVGLTGSQGPKGDTGAQGLVGLTGSQGPKGDTGSQGLAGLAGTQGPKGETGAQGLVGLTGSQGPKGDTGAQGLTGLAGAQGVKGDTGAQGLAGTQGPKGATGSQGTKGDTGTFLATVNNGLNFSTATNIQLGGNLITATTISNNGQDFTLATGASNLSITGLRTSSTANGILAVESNGVLKTIKATMPKFFYMPSIIIPTAADQVATGQTFGTINLHSIYASQFGSPKVKNSSTTTTLPVLADNELDYYITYFDETVFLTVNVSNVGLLTYTIKPGADVTIGSFMNIVFAVKP